jgi:hypothetical protein
MNRKRVLLISSVIVAILAASFVIGAFYSPYTQINTGGIVVESPPGVATGVSETRFEPSKPQSDVAVQERVVIYNAYISLETGDMEGGLAKIRRIAEQYGGYVAGSSRSNYGTQASAEISIRIPKEQFQTVVQEIENYRKVLDERTTSEDITQQYIDLRARLVNLQKQEERLQELLKIATTVDEILRVENELTRIRGEIDSLQGQINYLEGNAEMSLVSVTLTEPAPPFVPPSINWGETFEVAIFGLFTVLRGMIILAVSLVPLLIVGVPAYYVYKRRKAGRAK